MRQNTERQQRLGKHRITVKGKTKAPLVAKEKVRKKKGDEVIEVQKPELTEREMEGDMKIPME